MKINFLKVLLPVLACLALLSQTSIGLAQDTGAPPVAPAADNEAVAATDTTPPADVENVKAVAGDSEVTLTWDVATDNVGVTGYKIYYGTKSVTKEGENYEFPPIAVEDLVTATVENLENGKIYYFAVTAVDAAGNESESYSVEASAAPLMGLRSSSIEDDNKNPELKEAEALTVDSVRVKFSEPIVLPIENPEKAFAIKDLKVKRAEFDPEDEQGKAVILLTNAQTPSEQYELTVSVEIQDHYGNAVVRDHGDKTTFKGFKPAENDETAPEISEVKTPENNQVAVAFNEAVDLGANLKSHFLIVKKDGDVPLRITNVSLSRDSKTAYLTTDAQEKINYELRAVGVKDSAGNTMSDTNWSFEGKEPSLRDLIPPEDITELAAHLKEGQKNVVELTWKKSKNSAGDLADQLLYQSVNRGQTYGSGVFLGAEAEQNEVTNLRGGREYTFKITSKDTAGNESQGVTIAIKLPQTGPALPIALLISGLTGYFCTRRKKQ